MGPRTQTPQTLDAPHFQPGLGPDPEPCQGQPPPGGKVLELGRLFVKTVRHFWPQFNDWLETLPDTRFVPMVEYDRRFLLWWGCCYSASSWAAAANWTSNCATWKPIFWPMSIGSPTPLKSPCPSTKHRATFWATWVPPRWPSCAPLVCARSSATRSLMALACRAAWSSPSTARATSALPSAIAHTV